MEPPKFQQIKFRQACEGDLPELCSVRYADRPAVHLERIEKAAHFPFIRYIAAEEEGHVVGFVLLLLQPPDDWLNPTSPFPRMIDLFVAESMRGQGIGTTLLHEAECQAKQAGYCALHLSVDVVSNPRAHQLYSRLGYQPVQDCPIHKTEITDSDGTVHNVDLWLMELKKQLT